MPPPAAIAPSPPPFADFQAAVDWLGDQFPDHENADNFRAAFLDDPAGMAEYATIEAKGCCGSAEHEVIVAGRPAVVGCNYGH